MAGAIRRFPFLADAEAIRLVCHPDAMTPDANPLLGPLPGVRGFWVAAGLSLNGFGGGGGIGRAMAGWITAGDPGVDIGPYRAWRFGDTYRDPGFAAGLARETYSDYYRLRYPFDADLAGRPRRLSALHGRLQEAGAVFGTKAGWERADYHEPGRPWRRAGRDQAEYGWTRPPWFERVCAEARAVRERAGIIDLSSFGKIAVEGPGALGLLQRVSANDIDRPVGSVVYTQWCDERGGMVADVTVTRLADDRFRVVTGAGYVASELAWLRTHVADDEAVSIRDVSGDLATIGLWGPRARDVLVGAGAAADEVGNDAIPMRRSRSIRVGPAPVDAARISYAGELGWELTTPVEWAVTVWDRLRAAGAEFGLEPFGYRALDALRMEKGYRYFGTDLTMLDTPFEAGLGAFVRLDKGPFIGRDALVAAHATGSDRRLRTLVIGGPDYEPDLRRRSRPPRRRGRRPPAQRRLRPDRRAHDRLRLPAAEPGRGRSPRDRRLRPALRATVARDVLVDPGGDRMRTGSAVRPARVRTRAWLVGAAICDASRSVACLALAVAGVARDHGRRLPSEMPTPDDSTPFAPVSSSSPCWAWSSFSLFVAIDLLRWRTDGRSGVVVAGHVDERACDRLRVACRPVHLGSSDRRAARRPWPRSWPGSTSAARCCWSGMVPGVRHSHAKAADRAARPRRCSIAGLLFAAAVVFALLRAALELHDRAGCRHRDPVVEGAARGGAGGLRIGPGQQVGQHQARGPRPNGLSADFQGGVQHACVPRGHGLGVGRLGEEEVRAGRRAPRGRRSALRRPCR